MRYKPVLLMLFACTAAATAHANSLNVSTGLDSAGSLIATGDQPDAHWLSGTTPARTVYPVNADWYSDWVANGPGSAWIAIYPNLTYGNTATYVTTFDLTGMDLATAALSGSWTLDDAGTLSLNGHQLSSLGVGAWVGLQSFAASSSDFVQGVNTLAIAFTYNDNYLEGVRLQGTVTADPLPEPGVLALMGLGAVAIGARRRAAKRTAC
jgi:hypothetical protein